MKLHVCVRASTCVCVTAGQLKPFVPELNTCSSINWVA